MYKRKKQMKIARDRLIIEMRKIMVDNMMNSEFSYSIHHFITHAVDISDEHRKELRDELKRKQKQKYDYFKTLGLHLKRACEYIAPDSEVPPIFNAAKYYTR